MGRIKINVALGGAIFAFCLLLLSNFVGNTLIPVFKGNSISQVRTHDWIKWPEQNKTITEQKATKNNLENLEAAKAVEQPSSLKKQTSKSTNSIAILLTREDLSKGKRVARKCVACHSFEKGGKNKIGPNLFGIMGRQRGLVDEYNYSKALKKMGGKWDYPDMDQFLLKPRNFMPGTKMSFKGIKNANDRAALILYLRSFAETPIPLP
jgi:cytochrome c